MIGNPAILNRGLSENDVYPRTSQMVAPRTPTSMTQRDVDEQPVSMEQHALSVQLARSWVAAHLAPLRHLPPNWDSHGGRPLDTHTADTAERLVTQLLVQRVTPPDFYPTPDGGLSIEWRRPAVELAIELLPGARDGSSASVYFLDEDAAVEWEDQLTAAIPHVREILSTFVTPLGR